MLLYFWIGKLVWNLIADFVGVWLRFLEVEAFIRKSIFERYPEHKYVRDSFH